MTNLSADQSIVASGNIVARQDIDAALRVLNALQEGEVPHKQDAFRLRLLMPAARRADPLEQVALAISQS